MTEREMFEREYNERFPHDKSTLLKSGNYSGWIKQASWEMWRASVNREGYKLVPMKATYKMTVAASNHAIKTEPVLNFGDLYKAMIGATP